MSEQTAELPLHILFVFIDGVGLGALEEEQNPFGELSLPAFEFLAGKQRWSSESKVIRELHQVFESIDARLSVEGLPQSGTGQATLFSGINCAALAEKHFGPYPHSTSKPVLAQSNVFSQVNQLLPFHTAPSAFANAYPPPFFQHAKRRNRWTVTTLSCMEAGLPIRTEKDLLEKNALTAEITGRAWKERLNMPIEVLTEEVAAQQLLNIAGNHAFTLFEYYLTDKAGHSRNMEQATPILHSLDRFFAGIIQHIDIENTLFLITSDHGNIEDLSTKSHTLNNVPFIAYGKGASSFAGIESILHVTPTILETLRTFNSTSINMK